MEDLVSSPSFRSVVSCSEGQALSGESSWTDYFVDFMLSEEEKKRLDASSYCATQDEGKYDGDGSSREEEELEDSMISDAASHAPTAAVFPGRYKELKKLKKKPFKTLDHDDSLEDTASSPVNSPKVSYILQSVSFHFRSAVKFRLPVMLICPLFWVASLRSVLCHSWN